MAHAGLAMDNGWKEDSQIEDGDFRSIGISTDLMPTLLTMYDALYAKISSEDAPDKSTCCNEAPDDIPEEKTCAQPPGPVSALPSGLIRPISSISSSSNSSSSSLPRGTADARTASYLASAESLDLREDSCRRRNPKVRREKLSNSSRSTGVLDRPGIIPCHSISMPTPPMLRPRYCDPNLAYMDRVVLEIVETEAVYVRDLSEVIKGYLDYWRYHGSSGISLGEAEKLFSNIEQIYEFNKRFLRELEMCGVDPVRVAKCFVRNNNGFSIYTEYCTNYPKTVCVLTELMRSEAAVRAFRERQLVLGHTMPLGSYLLKPVQRILKYHLLLGNIVKHFQNDKPGYSDIWNALSAMTGMAHHINDMKRRHEHAVRVQEIQSLLYGWQGEDLTTYGELAAEGTFRVFGAKGVRHVFLFDKMILIAKKKEENALIYKTHIMCSNLMLIESVPGEPLSFHIIPFDNPRLQYTLEARNLEQKREWTLQLKRVILENYSADIPAHAKQLVMELGQVKPDDVLMSEAKASGSRRNHNAPQYLEKRKEKRRTSDGGGSGFNSRLRIRRSSRSSKDKESRRSRSTSRTRDNEDDDSSRKDSVSSCPSNEKTKFRLPIWRRKSEPGVGRRETMSVASSRADLSPNSSPSSRSDHSNSSYQMTEKEGLYDFTNNDLKSEVSVDGYCLSENTTEADEQSHNEENLEEIISQLLQHNLHIQQMILSKQRRGLLRKKKYGVQYETSDTENEDGTLSESKVSNESSPDYIDLCYHRNNCGERAYSSEETSIYSSALSVNYSGRTTDHFSKFEPGWNGSFSTWNNYSKDLEGRLHDSTFEERCSQSQDDKFTFPNGDIIVGDRLSSSPKCQKLWLRERKDDLGRPSSVVLYTSKGNFNDSTNECHLFSDSLSEKGCRNLYDVSSPEISISNLDNVHPDHKIYSKISSTKESFKNMFVKFKNSRVGSKLTLYSVENYDDDKNTERLVYRMAKQCSKTFRERIRQIRMEDEGFDNSQDSVPYHKQGSKTIGARLASSNDCSDYAVPRIRPLEQRPKSETRPDSVLSSSSILTSSSSSSSNEMKPLKDGHNSDTSCDSYYERSFEAIENELFRDSAIYSDPEDLDISFNEDRYLHHKNNNVRENSVSVLEDSYLQKAVNKFGQGSVINGISESKVPPPVPAKPWKNYIRGPVTKNLTATNVVSEPSTEIYENDAQMTRKEGFQTLTHCVKHRKVTVDVKDYRERIAARALRKGNQDPPLASGWVKHVIGKLQGENAATQVT